MSESMSLYEAQSLVSSPKAASSIISSREAKEVEAAVFMAKSFPRDVNQAISRILCACDRPSLAAKSIYSYPKGGTNVTGPSIRLVEAIAQSWGNIQSGVMELEQMDGESKCMAYAWDVENNVREVKIFTVKHKIATKKGDKVLTDPREIYELIANQGARRKRACLLNIIPGDVVDLAIERCNKTLSGGGKKPLIDRLREMTRLFETSFSVPLESIERYFGYKLDAFTEMDGQTLAGIYNALKDGTCTREQYFRLPKVPIIEEAEAAQEAQVSGKVDINDL